MILSLWKVFLHKLTFMISENSIATVKGVSVITITENTKSHLSRVADVVIGQHVNRENDKHNMHKLQQALQRSVFIYVL